jgi:hypothetical protein
MESLDPDQEGQRKNEAQRQKKLTFFKVLDDLF